MADTIIWIVTILFCFIAFSGVFIFVASFLALAIKLTMVIIQDRLEIRRYKRRQKDEEEKTKKRIN